MKFAAIVVNKRIWGGIEPLKLAFSTQVTHNQLNLTYNYNFRKNVKTETILIGVQKIVWLVKQPLDLAKKKTQ
jgi:hypothetical protein